MVLTRSQAKKLEENRLICGAVLGYLIDRTTPVRIYIESLNKDTKQYRYNGGNFYTAKNFKVKTIEPIESSSKRLRYSAAKTTLGQVVIYGDNHSDIPTLFFDKI